MENNDSNNTWKWILVLAVIAGLGFMTFFAGFGAGFGTGRVTSPQIASLKDMPFERTGPEGMNLPRITANSDLPREFDLLWEAWDALNEDFYGELPETPEMVGALVTGMLRAAEYEQDESLDLEDTSDDILEAVVETLEQQFGTLPEPSPLIYGAINGVTFALEDDYTFLRNPEQAEFFNEGLNGSFEGIGARVDTAEDGGVLIVEPFEGQPAWEAGIRRDDIILAVDDVDVTDMSLQDAIQLIRGPKGSKVVLLVRSPEQESREITVKRDRISIPAVEYEMLDNNIAYIRLGEFSTPSTRQLRDALDELQEQEPVGLILDLRGNPGGFLRTAVDISSEFIEDGPILVERFSDGEEQVYEASGNGRALDIPLVVLVNEASASASEILAGAIQDTSRGVLAGETTFGKGSVQVPHELSDGSMLSVTTARWFTPADQQIHGAGLVPDIQVERSLEDRAEDRDPQLEKAIEYLLENFGQ
ncbi:MAG: S41 family peptidase [Chloroflexota bacterium]|nr:S41 family peptidase [Chloroflexota bacterium]